MATYARSTEGLQPTSAADDLPEPKRTIAECEAIMTAPGQMHEWEEKIIEGRKLKVFKNTPPSMRDFWSAMAATWNEREYVVLGNERLTYGQVHEKAIVIANLLQKEFGCKKGDKVSVCMRNRPDWVIAFWAIHMFGGVAVAVNCWLSTEGLVHCLKLTDTVVALLDYERATQLRDQLSTLKDSGCRAILISQAKSDISGMEKLENLMNKYKNEKTQPQVEILPEDDCTIFFTSGTTGLPKAVLSTQRMFLTNLFTLGVAARRATLRRGEDLPVLSPDDPQKVLLLPVPLFHVTGTTSLLMLVTATGAKVIFMHKWSKKEGLRLLREEKVTLSGGVPFIVQEILESASDEDISTLENLTYGGAPAHGGLPRLHASRGTNSIMTQQYGLSETNSVIVGHGGEDYLRRPLSTGLPAIVNEVKVMDPEGKEVKQGDIGELWVKGPNVFKGYYKNQKATDECLTRDGWFRTGDLVSVDPEGFIYIRDRAKDIIIRGGENIAATAVEDALFKNPVIQDCAVVGVSDKKLGELPAAVVVLRSSGKGTTEQQIIDDAKKHLPRHSLPVMVIIRTADDDEESELRIERNPNGKIVKNQLKKVVELEWQRRTKAKL